MEVSSLRIQIRDARAHTSRANIRVKIADRKVSQMEEIAANARQKLLDCRRELDAEVKMKILFLFSYFQFCCSNIFLVPLRQAKIGNWRN